MINLFSMSCQLLVLGIRAKTCPFQSSQSASPIFQTKEYLSEVHSMSYLFLYGATLRCTRSKLYKYTMQRTNTENWKQILPEKELRGHSPNFLIHVSVSDLYIPTIDLPILLQEICGQFLEI
jgi:hypothetical protein